MNMLVYMARQYALEEAWIAI